jgi:hypothetical protein
MNAVEFTTELTGAAVLPIPREIAAQLPKSGKARILVLTDDATDDAEWRAGAYEQFLRGDSSAQSTSRTRRACAVPVPSTPGERFFWKPAHPIAFQSTLALDAAIMGQ